MLRKYRDGLESMGMEVKEAIAWQSIFKEAYKNGPKEAGTACDMASIALERQDSVQPITNKFYYFCPCSGASQLLGAILRQRSCPL